MYRKYYSKYLSSVMSVPYSCSSLSFNLLEMAKEGFRICYTPYTRHPQTNLFRQLM